MFIGCRFACSRAGPMCRLRHGSPPHRPPLYKARFREQMANCLLRSLAASKGRALICEGTAFGATQEKGGCRFTRSCQGNRLGILDLVENPGAGKRPVVSPSIPGEIPALKGQESRGKSRHFPLGKKTENQPSDDHIGLALGVDTLVTAGAAQSNHFRWSLAAQRVFPQFHEPL